MSTVRVHTRVESGREVVKGNTKGLVGVVERFFYAVLLNAASWTVRPSHTTNRDENV
jgi:hypothetical protein